MLSSLSFLLFLGNVFCFPVSRPTSFPVILISSISRKKLRSEIQLCKYRTITDILKNSFFKVSWVVFNEGQWFHHTETSQLVCTANRLNGFYMFGLLFVRELRDDFQV